MDFESVWLRLRDWLALWDFDWLIERLMDSCETLRDIESDLSWLRLRDALGALPNTDRLRDALIERDRDMLCDAMLRVPQSRMS